MLRSDGFNIAALPKRQKRNAQKVDEALKITHQILLMGKPIYWTTMIFVN